MSFWDRFKPGMYRDLFQTSVYAQAEIDNIPGGVRPKNAELLAKDIRRNDLIDRVYEGLYRLVCGGPQPPQ